MKSYEKLLPRTIPLRVFPGASPEFASAWVFAAAWYQKSNDLQRTLCTSPPKCPVSTINEIYTSDGGTPPASESGIGLIPSLPSATLPFLNFKHVHPHNFWTVKDIKVRFVWVDKTQDELSFRKWFFSILAKFTQNSLFFDFCEV